MALVADQEGAVVLAYEPDGLLVHLGDQGAGRVDGGELPLPAASACTVGASPRAENMTIEPSGTSVVSSTKIAPFFSRVCTTYLLWTISCRT
ncbi:hypothetical protein SMD11_6939 [Streptomyces albireticuli]|uniref:Uncharacterized protein n=1 Tax=Streptomyces albireticuli TaxID=1940 RepID=A0A1Z2LE16_9ACTN|nr:hypothetical protein SMD11_6939 [Streptomyces albireticuli]